MEKEPDTALLAQKLLDLWQEYLSSLASDPSLAQEANPFLNPNLFLNQWQSQSQGGHVHAAHAPFPFPFPWAPTAAFSPSASAASLEQLRDVLAAMEKRLAGIEAALAKRPATSHRRTSRKKD